MGKKIKIIGVGNDWVGIDKPWGMSVHNEPGQDVVSMVRAMASQGRIKGLESHLIRMENIQPVHRLDKETSGVLLLALTPEKTRQLSRAFQEGQARKHYLALIHGCFTEDLFSDRILKGTWNFPLSKEAGGRTNPGGKGKKVQSITHYRLIEQTSHYRLIEQTSHYSLLDIRLMTGRKHQIRRHAKLAGHPVTGDRRYGSRRALEYLEKRHGYTRLGLHARSLEIKNQGIALAVRELPPEIKVLMDSNLPTI